MRTSCRLKDILNAIEYLLAALLSPTVNLTFFLASLKEEIR